MVPQVPVPLALSGAGPSGEWGLVLVDYAGPTGLLGPSAWPVDPAAALGDMQLCFQPTPCLASTNTHPPLPPCPTSFLTPSETLHLCPSLPRAHTLPRLHRNSRSLRVRETLCAPTLFDDKMMLDDPRRLQARAHHSSLSPVWDRSDPARPTWARCCCCPGC